MKKLFTLMAAALIAAGASAQTVQESKTFDNIYVGVTHRDICMRNKNGVKDWGVLGCSISSNHACVVSDHRLKHNKSDLWKVAIHEFIHTYYAYPHCPKDSSQCLMKDAKGHADFRNKKDLCGFCKNKIRRIIYSQTLN